MSIPNQGMGGSSANTDEEQLAPAYKYRVKLVNKDDIQNNTEVLHIINVFLTSRFYCVKKVGRKSTRKLWYV